MDKILAINTIKNVFSALGAKTSDSNYGVALLDKTSGEPKGMMDFANLASVLGANELIVDNTYDANNMLNRGVVYRWNSSVPSNTPLSYAAMIVYKIGPTNYAQFCISRTWGNRHAMLKRVLKDNNEWSPWQRIYDEGILNDSAILSPLASALGGMRLTDSSIVNYADMTVSGLYVREPSTGISGSDIKIGGDGTYLFIAHFKFDTIGSLDIATIYNHTRYWIGFGNDWREL